MELLPPPLWLPWLPEAELAIRLVWNVLQQSHRLKGRAGETAQQVKAHSCPLIHTHKIIRQMLVAPCFLKQSHM